MMNKETKKNYVEEMKKIFSSNEAVMIAHYQGLNVVQLDELRKELRENGIIFKITKNRITKLAVKETPLKELEKFFTGPTAAAISSDPFMSARILAKFAKNNDKLTIGFLFNLVERNDFVDETVFSVDSSLYTPPSGCNSYQIRNNTKEVVVPLWVAIETFDFGALQRFCHYLNTNVMNKVLADFNLTPNDKDLFLNSLDVIRELRNKCAHFSLINRFSTSLSVKILPSLIKKQQLSPQEISRKVYIHTLQRKIRKNPAKLSLFDTLKVLAMYEDLSRLKKPLKALIYQNNKYFIKSTYDLNSRLLERMGNIDYIKWKDLFS